jgi:hypothetical protein
MEEKVIKEVQAQYLKSAVKLIDGYLILTNKRIIYSGTQVRVKFDHGVVGNIVRDKMEKVMGFDIQEEEIIFDIPLSDVNSKFKRYGFSKRLVISDKQNIEYKLMLMVKKAERDEWPNAIENAKSGI